jgi:hypothetical protein
MSIIVNQKPTTPTRDIFAPKSLVKSTANNGNIYLVIGPGDQPEHFAGVRLAGVGTFRYQDNIIKEFCVAFEGEVVISNE